jgi:hypothetical protein
MLLIVEEANHKHQSAKGQIRRAILLLEEHVEASKQESCDTDCNDEDFKAIPNVSDGLKAEVIVDGSDLGNVWTPRQRQT